MCLPCTHHSSWVGYYDGSLLGHMLTLLSARRSWIGNPTRTTETRGGAEERTGQLAEGSREEGVLLGTWPGICMPHVLSTGCLSSLLQPQPSCTLDSSHLSVCRVLMAHSLPYLPASPCAPSAFDGFPSAPAQQTPSPFKVSGVTASKLLILPPAVLCFIPQLPVKP